jgi:hypothetical protein
MLDTLAQKLGQRLGREVAPRVETRSPPARYAGERAGERGKVPSNRSQPEFAHRSSLAPTLSPVYQGEGAKHEGER